ncbi:MAG: hypothetical protein SCH70_07765 [Candidatus Methanoperedens sp.]|nr:hypothetical protein [Candidatus Methanoperedens sp.]
MQTKEQLNQIITSLKARKFELQEEQKIVDMQLAMHTGMLSILLEVEKINQPAMQKEELA